MADSKENKNIIQKKHTQQAESIYLSYPRKADKKNSIKSIIKLLKAGIPLETLITAIENYKIDIQRKSTQRNYIIQSNNFFGQAARWEEWKDGGSLEPDDPEPQGRAYQPFSEEL